MAVLGATVYFTSFNPASGWELWSSDGTAAGTSMVSDINPGSASSTPLSLTALGETLLFAAYEPVHGLELYEVPDTTPPRVLNGAYDRNASLPTVRLTMSESLLATSVSGDDLVVQNLTTSQTLPAGSASATLDNGTHTIAFRFSGFPHGLPDGNYRATLPAGSVNDFFGNPLAAAGGVDFFVLGADANGDRTVDTLDFNSLAANFGGSGRNYSQGDFNYDGVVDTLDFNTLASKFGKTLPPADALAPAASPFSSTVIDPLANQRDLDEVQSSAELISVV
jgi:ELWxxDGT repeat protein